MKEIKKKLFSISISSPIIKKIFFFLLETMYNTITQIHHNKTHTYYNSKLRRRRGKKKIINKKKEKASFNCYYKPSKTPPIVISRGERAPV